MAYAGKGSSISATKAREMNFFAMRWFFIIVSSFIGAWGDMSSRQGRQRQPISFSYSMQTFRLCSMWLLNRAVTRSLLSLYGIYQLWAEKYS